MRKQLRNPNVEIIIAEHYVACHSALVAESILKNLDSCLRRNDKLLAGSG